MQDIDSDSGAEKGRGFHPDPDDYSVHGWTFYVLANAIDLVEGVVGPVLDLLGVTPRRMPPRDSR